MIMVLIGLMLKIVLIFYRSSSTLAGFTDLTGPPHFVLAPFYLHVCLTYN